MKLFGNLKSKRIFYRILVLLLAMAGLMFLMAFLFMQSYVAQSYEQRNRESARQLLNTAGEYVDLAALDLGRSMQQLLWNTEVTAAILVPDEVSYQRKVEIVKALSTFEQDNPLVERACLLTYANQTLYDAQGNILPIKDSPERIYMKQFTSNVWSQELGNGDFSTMVLTVDGSVALLQDFPTPEENGALLEVQPYALGSLFVMTSCSKPLFWKMRAIPILTAESKTRSKSRHSFAVAGLFLKKRNDF